MPSVTSPSQPASFVYKQTFQPQVLLHFAFPCVHYRGHLHSPAPSMDSTVWVHSQGEKGGGGGSQPCYTCTKPNRLKTIQSSDPQTATLPGGEHCCPAAPGLLEGQRSPPTSPASSGLPWVKPEQHKGQKPLSSLESIRTSSKTS